MNAEDQKYVNHRKEEINNGVLKTQEISRPSLLSKTLQTKTMRQKASQTKQTCHIKHTQQINLNMLEVFTFIRL